MALNIHIYLRRRLRCFLCCLLCCLCCGQGLAAAASNNNFACGQAGLITRDGVLWLNMPLSVTNEDALGELLRDRATLELRIKTATWRKRSLWFNENIADAEFVSRIRHDPLIREFKLTRPTDGQVISDILLRRLLSVSWKKLELPLAPSDKFKPGENYLIEIDLSLQHAELPSWLERTLVFWITDVVDSEHLTLDYKVEDAAVSR